MLDYLAILFGEIPVGPEGFYRFGDRFGRFHELRGFGRRNPGELDPFRFDSDKGHQILKKGELSSGVVITFQVMAFTRMSAGHPHPVGPFPQSRQEKLRAHPPCARDPDHPDIGRILHPAHPGQVRRSVTAPVTKKTYDFRFPFVHD